MKTLCRAFYVILLALLLIGCETGPSPSPTPIPAESPSVPPSEVPPSEALPTRVVTRPIDDRPPTPTSRPTLPWPTATPLPTREPEVAECCGFEVSLLANREDSTKTDVYIYLAHR